MENHFARDATKLAALVSGIVFMIMLGLLIIHYMAFWE